MSARQAGRLWLIGGTLAIVILVVATYFLTIKPVYDETAAKETQILDADADLRRLERKLDELKDQVKNKNSYARKLAAKKAELPDNYDIPNFLRQLQTSDGSVKVVSNSIGISAPVEVDGSTTVVGMPIVLTVTGRTEALTRFLGRVHNAQSRAVLLTTVTLNVADDDGESSINAMLTAYCSKSDDDDCQVATG